MRWAVATVAPWALGIGLLVSFTATAGHDLQSGISAAAALGVGIEPSEALVPPSSVRASASLPYLRLDGVLQQAGLRFDLPGETEAEPEHLDVPPRADLKTAAKAFPSVDRSRKGDPLVSLRPSLSRRAGELRHGAGSSASRLLFRKSERALPSTVLMPGPVHAPEAENAFAPWAEDEETTTRRASAARSPSAAASGSTGAARGGGATPGANGATPGVPRAVALSSTTPAPADATPVEIAAAPVSPMSVPSPPSLARAPAESGISAAPRTDPTERPNYADLVSPDALARERHCLAQAVYFEARSEPAEGQAAVAQVVLNRAKSGLYPATICGVVFQNRHRHLACQFTFTCEGKSLRVTDRESWQNASRIATEVLEGRTYLAEVGGSTHYHADYVRPRWARRLKKMDVIGRHIFYKLKPGQT